MSYVAEVPGDCGPDKEENAIIEVFTVQASENIEKGEILKFDATGVMAATLSTTAQGPYYVALEASTYTTASDHYVRCGVVGVYDVQLESGEAIYKGQAVQVSSTAGEIEDAAFTDFWYSCGLSLETVGTTVYSCKILMGHGP